MYAFIHLLVRRFGRLMGMLLFNVIRFAGALLSLYAGSYGVFATGRFVVAVGATGANLCAYVMSEYAANI